jgi:hypothetical protein
MLAFDHAAAEHQTRAAHRLRGEALEGVEDSAFWRGFNDAENGRVTNPYHAVFEPDAYEAWNIGQDAHRLQGDA